MGFWVWVPIFGSAFWVLVFGENVGNDFGIDFDFSLWKRETEVRERKAQGGFSATTIGDHDWRSAMD